MAGKRTQPDQLSDCLHQRGEERREEKSKKVNPTKAPSSNGQLMGRTICDECKGSGCIRTLSDGNVECEACSGRGYLD
jgi:DnaJ-class molecular chaperone